MSHASVIPERSLTQHMAILGKTGSGKTFAAKGIVERLLSDGRQVCVLDPTGAWWGLRLGADGKRAGFDIVLIGGKHADIPLAERSGAAVARLVTQQHASVVVDTSGFTVGEYTRWFIDFAGTLYTTIREPLHLVIDEAHHFMPQGKAPDVDAGKMIHAGNRLMSGGRSLGIRGIMITQRPAKLHKDSLTCADTLIAMRVVAPQDRDAIQEWIDGCGDPAQGKAVTGSLAGLSRGEGWVWYPEGGYLHRTKFPPIKTYDSSATPEHGSKASPNVGAIDLAEVRAALADAVKEAEANDPKLLRRRIAELEAAPASGAGHGIGGGLRRILIALANRPQGLTNRQIGLRAGLSSQSGTFSTYLSKARSAGWMADRGDVRLITDAGLEALGPFDPLPTGAYLRAYWLNELGGGAARILQALCDAYPRAMSNEEIGAAAGISHVSGTFSTYMSRLRGLELVSGSRGATTASEELFS